MALPPPAPDAVALVTGASAGMGREFARALARRGYGVALVARRADRLEQLAAELSDRHGVRAESVPADLSEQRECDRVVEELRSRGVVAEILVNNAGFGIYEPFADSSLERELEQIAVLVTAVARLNKRCLPAMLERGRGAIINMSSTAGFQALPGNGTYAACKSWVLLHSEALHEEVRDRGVTVTAVCPGPVRTEFQEVSEPLFADQLPKFVWADSERVAEDALHAVERGRRSVIPGGLGPRSFFGPNRIVPARVTVPVARRLMSKELDRGGSGDGAG